MTDFSEDIGKFDRDFINYRDVVYQETEGYGELFFETFKPYFYGLKLVKSMET